MFILNHMNDSINKGLAAEEQIRIIDLNDYVLSGGGKLGESYTNKNNPDELLKLYSKKLEQNGLEEYKRACKVYSIGVPCPAPGKMVCTTDGRLGITYTRIIGKKSYARALSHNPERLQEYAEMFAKDCKELHSIKPAPGLFNTAKEQYKSEIKLNPYLSDQEKNGVFHYIDTLPDADTAVHGDLHHGNVIITDDGHHYFIDLSDFCTGTPLFDLGVIMLQTCLIPDEMERELYHIGLDTSKAFWEAFVHAYYGPDVPVQEVEARVRPYAFLRILTTERLIGFKVERIRPVIHQMISVS